MNGEVVNLNKARKAKTKVEKAQAAAQNRVSFGRTKAERAATGAETDRLSVALDAHKRELEP